MHDPRLEKLKKQQEQLAAKIKDHQARNRAKSRKDDTRRKIIAGALALHHLEKNPHSPFAQTLTRLLDEYVTKPHERALFDLPPLPENAPGEAAPSPANDDDHNAEGGEILPLKERFRAQ